MGISAAAFPWNIFRKRFLYLAANRPKMIASKDVKSPKRPQRRMSLLHQSLHSSLHSSLRSSRHSILHPRSASSLCPSPPRALLTGARPQGAAKNSNCRRFHVRVVCGIAVLIGTQSNMTAPLISNVATVKSCGKKTKWR